MIEMLACAGAVILSLFELIILYLISGNLPVFNIFESFMLMSFIMSSIGLLVFFRGEPGLKVRRWIWMEILILFILMLFFPKEASLPAYDHSYIYIILFHGFRCVSLALMLIATAWFIQFIIQRETNERTSLLAHKGRNYLVLSAIFFLMAEYVGIIWCQNGWGDFWTWSQAFFQSTLVVLYLMLAFHIPGKGRRSEDIRCLIGGLNSVFVLVLTLMRSFY